MIRSDKWITRMAREHGMIEPFVEKQVRVRTSRSLLEDLDRQVMREAGHELGRVISYGVSSYGYDIRVAEDFKIFTPTFCGVVDPKALDEQSFQDVTDSVRRKGYCLIPPNSFALARAVECFSIPKNVMTICVGKSSYARVGILVNVTPFEPGWRGYPTLEISNSTPLPAKIYANEGIAQVIFFEADEQCAVTYADRQGKYQDQPAEIVLPRA